MQYRREIDGLRAVAVLPVILFHAGFSMFGGGFVGVDVFFVISGYLITHILIDEITQGKFSILGFYERRARRILPALFLVILACLPFAYTWMVPSQLEDFSASIVTVILSLSNIFFLSKTNYFAQGTEFHPLLHTWSLAIEEQYYVLFPLLLLLMRKLSIRLTGIAVVLLTLLSFVFSEWAWREDAARSFFFSLSRFWEIGFGSICAFLTANRPMRGNNILSLTGFALILYAIIFYNENIPFPSSYTLVPIMGAALVIIFATEGTWVARLLSTRGFVGIGLISYSAYLWHQPLFVFARLRSVTDPGHVMMAILSVITLLLAWATWFWVERSFRKGETSLIASQRNVFVVSAAFAVLFVVFGLAGYIGKGFEGRFSNDLLNVVRADRDRADDSCHFNGDDNLPRHPVKKCQHLSKGSQLDVMLLGDSHSLATSQEVGALMQGHNINYYNVSYSGCIPLPGFVRLDKSNKEACSQFAAGAYSYAEKAGIDVIVLAARYPLYFTGERYNNGEGGVEGDDSGGVDLIDVDFGMGGDDARRSRVISAYEEKIREIAKKFKVVLVYPIPEAGWNVPSYALKEAYLNQGHIDITTSYSLYKKRTHDVAALFDRLENDPNIYSARAYLALCSDDTDRCLNADKNGVYYFDDDHLSNAGARLVAPMILDAIKTALSE